MFNVNLIGNLGRDAECVTMTDSRMMMKFPVAAETGKDSMPIWCDVLMPHRDALLPYLKKGTQVYIAGRCTIKLKDNYMNVNVYPDQLQLCGTKNDQSQDETPGV